MVVDGSNAVQFAISVEVREGEIMAMLGASGAGKSTLIDMLLGWI
jgi:ABC-type multidrug transport system ATPase subunit